MFTGVDLAAENDFRVYIFLIRPSKGVICHISPLGWVEGVQLPLKIWKNRYGTFSGVLFDAETEFWVYFCHPPL